MSREITGEESQVIGRKRKGQKKYMMRKDRRQKMKVGQRQRERSLCTP